MDFTGRHVVVSGGSRGIGAACCFRFAELGASVAVHFHTDADSAAAVVEACSGGVGTAFAVQADLATKEGGEALFSEVERRWGGLDCLVNNAGIWEANPIDQLDEARLQTMWRLNVDAVFRCTGLAVPLLGDSTDGNIVNISSTAAQRGEARHSPYAASKGALVAATKSWSTELAPGIRVNSVAPGWVDTDMCTATFADGGRESVEAAIPLGRVASPDDIARPVVFLASEWARHITGEILNVNGGSVLAG